jgi:ELWxxDGT repeat protein
MKKFVLVLLVFSVKLLTAQNPVIVKPVGSTVLEPKNKDQEIWQNNEWNGKFFYQGTGANCKLCVTDGTTAGTIYLKDLNADLFQFTIPAQNFIYIITEKTTGTFPSLVNNVEIWKSDGTVAGTVLVKAMPPYNPFSSSQYETWTSDANLDRNFSVDGDVMYFGGYDAANGNELWSTDGTAAGTYLVKDIRPGTGNSNVGGFCKVGGTTLFRAAVTGFNYTLWKTDGTAIGTEEIIIPGLTFWQAPVGKINNKLIFYGYDGVNGAEPWVSDGTVGGTYLLADINAGTANSTTSSLQNLHLRFNDKYCFFIANKTTGANNLWRTDGTITGTIQLTSTTGLGSNFSGGGYSDIDNTGLWWLEGNEKLYKSDGTVAGTSLATTTLSNALYLKIYKSAAWFHSRRASINNPEPWRSDGTAANTNIALEVQPADLGCYPYGFFVTNNKLHFFSDYAASKNLYQYNGDFTFNGGVAGGKWKDSANWNSMLPPGITDSVFINTGTPNALNINGSTAYAGTLIMQNNAVINFTNPTDSLIINNRLAPGSNNNFTGTGVLALRNNKGDSVQINNGFTAGKLSVQSNSNLITGNISIANNINLSSSGKLILNNNNFTLTGTSSTATASASNYIVTNGSGKMFIENIGTGARTGTEVFPIGTATSFNPVTFSNAGTADIFGARIINGVNFNYTGETPQSAAYVSGAVNAAWFITEAVAGGSDATIGLQWNAAQELPSFNRSIAQLGHFTGGIWNLGTAGVATGTDPYNYSRNNINSFSPFGIFNNNAALPVRYAKLLVTKNLTGNKLQWIIDATDAVTIELEKSADAVNFTKFYQTQYTATGFYNDAAMAGKIYYRLKVTEVSGKITYSNIVWINDRSMQITVFPNFTNTTFIIQNSMQQYLQLLLYSSDGKLLSKKNLQPGNNIIDINFFANGIYYYHIHDGVLNVKNGAIIKN